jgi:uncharacterized membrane protein
MAAENVDEAELQSEPQTEPVTTDVENSGTGLDENVAGALAYAFGFITGIIFFVIDDRPSVKFHGAQSIVLAGALFLTYIGLVVANTFLSIVINNGILSLGVWLVFLLAWAVVGFGGFAVWLYMLYSTYTGKMVELPVIGNIAKRIAGQ